MVFLGGSHTLISQGRKMSGTGARGPTAVNGGDGSSSWQSFSTTAFVLKLALSQLEMGQKVAINNPLKVLVQCN
jgi:hypothetical protein